MASKAAIQPPPPGRFPKANIEDVGPSQVREDDMAFSRVVGLVSACLTLFGGLVLAMSYAGRTSIIPAGLAVVSLSVGLAGLLFHAAFDRDIELRRLYLFLGFGLLLLGVILALIPGKDGIGYLFGIGYPLMLLGLLFQVAVLRNETDPSMRGIIQNVQLGAGSLMAFLGLLLGFWFAEGRMDFLVPSGVMLGLLGLGYLVAAVSAKGTGDDLSYRIGLGIGALGLLVLFLAVVRSLAPSWFHARSTNFLLPWGLVLGLLGLVYVLTSVGLVSDNRLIVMTRRELGAFFFSPIAYLVLIAFTITHGLHYIRVVEWLARRSLQPTDIGVSEPVVQIFLFSFFSVVCTIFVIPALTMRLLSEESRTGTLEVMLTAPVEEASVVLSKFLAALLMFLLMWLPLGLFLVALRVGGGKPFDYQPLMSFFIVILFTGANFIAMGVFFSSLSRNQIISAVLTFAGMLTLTTLYFFQGGGQTSASTQTILKHMSYVDLWENAAQGQLVPRYLLFHASMAIFWLFLSVKVLESRKWK